MRGGTFQSVWIAALLATGCGEGRDDAPAPSEPDGYADPWDLQVSADGKADGVPARFDPDFVVSDALFLDADAVDADVVQGFFEETPYGGRSWLADERVHGRSAAEALVAVAHARGINPILLLARMQVEAGLVSASERPNQTRVDFAMGCGCPDHSGCGDRYRGLDRQIDCAAESLRNLFDGSTAGTGEWRAGEATRTLDPQWVTPANHATAALYGYTPWVLRGRGGNWLVWNVTRRYARHFEAQGLLGPAGCISGGPDRPFVGSPCACDADCDFFAGGAEARCHEAGFCTIPCAGYCPDLAGHAPTFCVADAAADAAGMCVSKAVAANGHCADLTGTLDREAERFIGSSGAAPSRAEVCLPAE